MTIAEFPALLDTARKLADQFALSAGYFDATGPFPHVNFDQLFEAGLLPAIAKHKSIDNAVAVTSLALELVGNPGLKRNHPLERHHRDALCGRAQAPQNNLIRSLAAKAALTRRAHAPPAEAAKAPPASPKPKFTVVGG